MIFHPLTFNLLVSIGRRWASYRQCTDGCCFFNNNFIYDSDRESERGRQKIRQREKQTPHQEPNMGLNPRLQDHSLGQRQMLNPWATQASRILCLSHSDTLYLLIGTFSLSAFRVIIQRYELVPLCYRRSCSFWWRSLVLSRICCFWSLFSSHLKCPS